MLRDSVVVVVVIVRTRPRAIPLAMITMRKSTHGFPFVSHIWVAYGAPLGRWSSAITVYAVLTVWREQDLATWHDFYVSTETIYNILKNLT